MSLRATTFLGIDSGLRGGGGACVIAQTQAGFRVLEGVPIPRLPEESEVAVIVKTVNAVLGLVDRHHPVAVGREDHNFLGTPERMSRNVLRRINGALDYALCGSSDILDPIFVPGTTYLAFAPNTWKAVAGIPGDIGKTTRGLQKGEQSTRFKKRAKGSKAEYLAQLNAALGYEWENDNVADAHGVAIAVARVYAIRLGTYPIEDETPKTKDAVWDRKACLGKTRAAWERAMCRDGVPDNETFRRGFAQFVRHFAP